MQGQRELLLEPAGEVEGWYQELEGESEGVAGEENWKEVRLKEGFFRDGVSLDEDESFIL